MVTIDGAAAARTSDADPLTTIGMVGEHPEAALVAARAALETATSMRPSRPRTTPSRLVGAWQEGRRRTLLLIAVLATIVVLASAVVGRIRGGRPPRRRRRDRNAGPRRARTASIAMLATDADPTPEELLAASTPPLPDAGARDPTGPPGGPA